MSSFKSRLGLGVCASVLTITSVPTVLAQGNTLLEELVVTAQRRETLLSETPISMTAASQEMLRDAGITDPTDLDSIVPGANFSDSGDEGLRISIRGVYSNDSTEVGDQSAAFFYDGIYMARSQAQGVAFYDLERVEILRGPQGTLFGRNSTAGLIHVISARPVDEFEASIDLSAGSYGHTNATAMINAPISDRVAARFAVNMDEVDGPIDYRGTSSFGHQPVRDVTSMRLSFTFDISDALDLYVRADSSSMQGTRYNEITADRIFVNQGSGLRVGCCVDPMFSYLQDPLHRSYAGESLDSDDIWVDEDMAWQPYIDNKDSGIHADLTWSLSDTTTLNYLVGVRKFERDENWATLEADRNYQISQYDQVSHELRLSYDTDRLNFQGGVYMFEEEYDLEFAVTTPGNLTSRFSADAVTECLAELPPWPPFFGAPNPNPYIDCQFWAFDNEGENNNMGVFAQGTYALSDRTNLTLGARWSEDEKRRTGSRYMREEKLVDAPLNIVTAYDDNYYKTDDVTFRIGLDYDSDWGLVFATASTGYKSGGFNNGCDPATSILIDCTEETAQGFGLTYEPEELGALEVGFKWRFLNDRLALDGSIFVYDYENLQLSTVRDIGGGQTGRVTTNAESASINGAELTGSYYMSDSTRLDFGLEFLNAEYDSFNPVPCAEDWFDFYDPTLAADGCQETEVASFDGKPLDRSPEFVMTAGINHVMDLSNGGNLTFDARYRYSDQYFIGDLNAGFHWVQPGYHTTDLSVTYNAPDDGWYITGFAKNLEDEIIIGDASVAAGGGGETTFSTIELEQPRSYGVRAGLKF